MKISQIHVFAHPLSVVGGAYTYAGTTIDALDTTIVKVVADNGLVGWGEVCPLGPTYQADHALGARAALAQMAPGLLGATLTPKTLHREMDRLLAGHNAAKAALDIAAYDVIGKHLGVPVHDLLGGGATERVPSYYAVGIGSPDETARIAREKVAEGYPRLQLKVGGRDVQEDIAVLRKTHEAVGGRVPIAADANRSLNVGEALTLSRMTVDISYVLEQPCALMEEVAAIRPRIHHPIYLDETTVDVNAVLYAVGEALCDGFGFKVTRLGGLAPMMTVRDICAARNLPHTCDDSWGGDIVAAACVHIGATVDPNLNEGVWLAAPYIDHHYDPHGGIGVKDGFITVPTGPGLGITPDETLFGVPVVSFG